MLFHDSGHSASESLQSSANRLCCPRLSSVADTLSSCVACFRSFRTFFGTSTLLSELSLFMVDDESECTILHISRFIAICYMGVARIFAEEVHCCCLKWRQPFLVIVLTPRCSNHKQVENWSLSLNTLLLTFWR